MKSSILIFLSLFLLAFASQIEDVIRNLALLEYYAQYFKDTHKDPRSTNFLTMAYIRSAHYNDTEWEIAAGKTPYDFIAYISDIDKAQKLTISSLRGLQDITTYSGEKLDFIHMFAVMNGCDHVSSFTHQISHLVGWAGDVAQMFNDIRRKTGTFEELYRLCKDAIGRSGGLDAGDLTADLDAVALLKLKYDNPNMLFAELYKKFYESGDYKKRVGMFIKYTFPELKEESTVEEYRKVVFETYANDLFIKVWECKYGLREPGIMGCVTPGDVKQGLEQHEKAANYAWADWLYENRGK